ncbi:hypothetical protein N9J72_01810 [Candidatus Gracilibacteria bacterium]|nr:hypothetical protein [Candidatus Gracilibacteria bacterium]
MPEEAQAQELIAFCNKRASARGGFSDYFGKPEDFKTNGGNILGFVLKRPIIMEEGESEVVFKCRSEMSNGLRNMSYVGLTKQEKITQAELEKILGLRRHTKANEGSALYIFHSSEGISIATPLLNPDEPEEDRAKILKAGEESYRIERYNWGSEEDPEILKDDKFSDASQDTLQAAMDTLEKKEG